MGRHEVGFVDNTVKTPISNGEGCLFEARFKINKVRYISKRKWKNKFRNVNGIACLRGKISLHFCLSLTFCVVNI